MVHYYTNRELSRKLEINLARWKRWSRSFLPPDPLGGMQSGYARQYLFKDLFKVILGGHLLSLLKMPVAESRQVLDDLTPWLKKNGFLDWNGLLWEGGEDGPITDSYRIYFCPQRTQGTKNGSRFHYLIRHTVDRQINATAQGARIVETYADTSIHFNQSDGSLLFRDSDVRMINITALFNRAVERLCRQLD